MKQNEAVRMSEQMIGFNWQYRIAV